MIPTRRRIANRTGVAVAMLAIIGILGACQQKKEESVSTSSEGTSATSQPAETTAASPSLAAGHIEVQHVLIGFQGSVPGKNITRTKDEANKLAHEILEKAKKGEDFGQLVQQNTDDQYPGIYGLADRGVAPNQGEYPRDQMVSGFSDTAFSLKVGEVGIAEYDPQTSKYGWHIIKRLR